MSQINLRDFYKTNCVIDVPGEVLAVFVEHERREAAYRRRMYYHKAHYSIDREDGIENSIQFVSLSPDEIYTRKLTTQQLHAAIAALLDKQAEREKTVAANEYGAPISMGRGEIPMRAATPTDTLLFR